MSARVTASSTVSRQARGAAFPLTFVDGETAWNLPDDPHDGDVAEAAGQALDAIGGVMEGELFMARALDGGLQSSAFTPGNEAAADDAVERFSLAIRAHVPWVRLGRVQPISDPAAGLIQVVAPFAVSSDAEPTDSIQPPRREARLPPWRVS